MSLHELQWLVLSALPRTTKGPTDGAMVPFWLLPSVFPASACLTRTGTKQAKGDCFVEVSHHAGDNRIDWVRSFRTNRLLVPYLEYAKLEGEGENGQA